MLNEKQIEALKNGAYGVNRQGQRVRVVSTNHRCPHSILCVVEVNGYDEFQTLRSDLTLFEDVESGLDIVGLWEDKPEPFNLERALDGKPIKHKTGKDIYYLVGKSQFDGVFYSETKRNGNTVVDAFDIAILNNAYVMAKEPERVQKLIADDLPKPIREFGDLTRVWFISKEYGKYEPLNVSKITNWTKEQKESLDNGCYFATEEDAQANCDWLMNR